MIDKQKLTTLYSSGKSMTDISKILGYSPNKVVYWMRKHNIKRRSLSQAIYLQQNPNGDPFKIEENLNPQQLFLKGLAIGIYWGEGSKRSKHALRVANTDPYIIKNFIKFLKEVCNLEDRKITFSLICFNDINKTEALNYWVKELKISPKRFGKITVIPTQGKGTYKRKSQFGVCTINANNYKLRNWLMGEIDKLKNQPD